MRVRLPRSVPSLVRKSDPFVGSSVMAMSSGVPLSASEALSTTSTPSGWASSTRCSAAELTAGRSLTLSMLMVTVLLPEARPCESTTAYANESNGRPYPSASGT